MHLRRQLSLLPGEWPIDHYTDINAVCDLIKAWFRVLPGGMFPSGQYSEIIAAAGAYRYAFPTIANLTTSLANDSPELEVKLAKIRGVVQALPSTHFDLLKRLMEHLDRYVLPLYSRDPN